MIQEETAKADTPTEALADLELTAKEDQEIKGATGGVIPVYFHVIRKSSDGAE